MTTTKEAATRMDFARMVVGYVGLSGRSLYSIIEDLESLGNDSSSHVFSLTDDECRELSKETIYSYEEIRKSFEVKNEESLCE